MLSEGLKAGHRMEVYEQLRSKAYANMDLRGDGWFFEVPPLIHSWRLRYNGDAGDIEKLTYLLTLKIKRVLEAFEIVTKSGAELEAAIQERLHDGGGLIDDNDAETSIWDAWRLIMMEELNIVYKFLLDNGFRWPPEAGNYLIVASVDGGKPRVPFRPS